MENSVVKPDEKTKKEIISEIAANPALSNKVIAQKYNVPVRAVANLRTGWMKRQKHKNIEKKTKKKIRDELKSGNTNRKHIAEKFEVSESDVELIQKEVIPELFNKSSNTINTDTLSNHEKYVHSFDFDQLFEILIKTADALTGNNRRNGFLLFRKTKGQKYCPREIDAQLLMSTILSDYGYYHIIENPISDFNGRTDLSICSPVGLRIADIEFKINQEGVKDDFFKLFRSNVFGAVSFFISVDYQLKQIIESYKSAYREKFDHGKYDLIKDKWFLLFYLSCKKKRVYAAFFDNIKTIKDRDFRVISECQAVQLK